jgi:hypothetical protein
MRAVVLSFASQKVGNLCPCELLILLAGLISYGAGSLACGLAGCLALAAAALLDCIL